MKQFEVIEQIAFQTIEYKMNDLNLTMRTSLKEKFEVLSVEELLNLKKIYQNSNDAHLDESEYLNEILFKELTIIYCDDYRDVWKILTKAECAGKLSKLTRSMNVVLNNCKFIRKLELIGDLTPIFKTTNFFEEFTSLELLEIFDKNQFKSLQPEAYTLKLNKLAKIVLHFYCEPKRINKITLDTPSLKWLTVNFDPSKLIIKHEETINTLECDECLGNVNLPNIHYIWMSAFFNYHDGITRKFPQLRDFHFLDSDSSSINNLLNELKTANKNVNIYQNNILINDLGLLNSYSVILDHTLLNIYKRYETKLASRLHFVKDIQLEFNIEEIPETMFSRMHCLSHIKVSHKITNFKLWTTLLKSCMKLGSIRLKTRIEQQYLDIIPVCCPQINRLVIDFEIENLKFINDLRELTYLSIEQELPIHYFKGWIQSYQFVKIIQFYHHETQYTIEFLENKIYFSNMLCEILIKPIHELVDNLHRYNTWTDIFKQMKDFLQFDYRRIDNLAYKIEIEPEINFTKLLK